MKLGGVPLPPSMNNAYPTNRYGVRFKSKDYRQWEKDLKVWALLNHSLVKEAIEAFSIVRENHIVQIDTHYFFPWKQVVTLKNTPKKNDTSNRLKILHDGIADLIKLDDSYFWHGSFTKTAIPPECNDSGYVDVHLTWVPAPWGESCQKRNQEKKIS